MAVVAMTSCGGGSDDSDTPNPPAGGGVTVEKLAGEWHLTSLDSSKPAGDVYISFAADGTFELYQLAYHAGYDRYTGRFSLENNGSVLTGVYSDNTPWATSYACSIDAAGTTLILTGQNSDGIISYYTKSAIPDDVKNSIITKAAATDQTRWL